jgi:hypothetical protein
MIKVGDTVRRKNDGLEAKVLGVEAAIQYSLKNLI